MSKLEGRGKGEQTQQTFGSFIVKNTTQRLPRRQKGREDPRWLPGARGVGDAAPGAQVPQRGVVGE